MNETTNKPTKQKSRQNQHKTKRRCTKDQQRQSLHKTFRQARIKPAKPISEIDTDTILLVPWNQQHPSIKRRIKQREQSLEGEEQSRTPKKTPTENSPAWRRPPWATTTKAGHSTRKSGGEAIRMAQPSSHHEQPLSTSWIGRFGWREAVTVCSGLEEVESVFMFRERKLH